MVASFFLNLSMACTQHLLFCYALVLAIDYHRFCNATTPYSENQRLYLQLAYHFSLSSILQQAVVIDLLEALYLFQHISDILSFYQFFLQLLLAIHGYIFCISTTPCILTLL